MSAAHATLHAIATSLPWPCCGVHTRRRQLPVTPACVLTTLCSFPPSLWSSGANNTDTMVSRVFCPCNQAAFTMPAAPAPMAHQPARLAYVPCPPSSTALQKAGVADPNAFKDRPEILMYGMLCVMIAAAFWDIFRCVGGKQGGISCIAWACKLFPIRMPAAPCPDQQRSASSVARCAAPAHWPSLPPAARPTPAAARWSCRCRPPTPPPAP